MSCKPYLDCQITAVATAIESMMTDVATIQVRTLTGDGSGGQGEAWNTETAGVACFVEPSKSFRSGEEELSGRTQARRNFKVSMPIGTIVDEERRLKLTTYRGAVLTTPRYFQINSVMGGTFIPQLIVECVELPGLLNV